MFARLGNSTLPEMVVRRIPSKALHTAARRSTSTLRWHKSVPCVEPVIARSRANCRESTTQVYGGNLLTRNLTTNRIAQQAVDSVENQSKTPSLVDAIRQFRVSIAGRIHDSEIGSAEEKDFHREVVALLNSNVPLKVDLFKCCCGGEVRLEIESYAAVVNSDTVHVTGEMRLYEGMSCETQELADVRTFDFKLERDSNCEVDFRLVNDEPFGGDWAKGRMVFTNTVMDPAQQKKVIEIKARPSTIAQSSVPQDVLRSNGAVVRDLSTKQK